jgi:hypothetical protein
MESELVFMSRMAREAVWLRAVLSFLGAEQGVTAFFNDNKAAISAARTGRITKRNKHIDIKHRYVHQCFNEGKFEFLHMATNVLPTDFMTKSPTQQKLALFWLCASMFALACIEGP